MNSSSPPPTLDSKPTLHSQSNLPLILMVIFLLFLFGLGGLFLGKYLFGPQTVPPIPTLAPKPTTVPTVTPDLTADWKTYSTKRVHFSYPTGWQVEEKEIEGTLTYLIKKGDGDSRYNTTIYVGSPFIFSTSGSIDANQPYGRKVGKITFTIERKTYTPEIVELEKYDSKGPTGEKYYRSQAELGTLPGSVTVQFLNLSDKDTISQILSTFKFLP